MIALFLAAATFSADYDCALDAPKALDHKDGVTSLNPIGFPGVAEGNWKFQAKVRRDDEGAHAAITWPGDPIQIAGEFPAMPTADGSIAIMTFSSGPCMFTETGCLALVNLVDRGDGSAKVIITPSALWSDKANNSRDPFIVLIEGTCRRIGKPE